MYTLRDGLFHPANATEGPSRRIAAGSNAGRADWHAKQLASVDEYQTTQVADATTDDVTYIFRILRSFVAEQILERAPNRPTILDVGCGMSPQLPRYVRGLETHSTYVGLDPMPSEGDRDYLFVNGRIEDAADLLDSGSRFDIFLFSTSLDHFEDIREAARAVRAVAAPGAIAIFLVGLHDPSLVASTQAEPVVRRLFDDLRPQRFLLHLARTSVYFGQVYPSIAKRERMLARGQALDPYHFHYFTTESLPRSLAPFGDVTSFVPIRGTNAILCQVTLG